MAAGPGRRRRAARIGDDEHAAAALLRFEVAHHRRHRFGGVGADEQDDRGLADVFERERQAAVDAEGAGRGRRRRRHAEAAVVVDVGRADGDACELAEQVDLFVGERPASQHADRVAAMALLGVADCVRRRRRARRSSWFRRAHRCVRTSGARRRSPCVSVSAAVQPLRHRPPRLTGNFGSALMPGACARCAVTSMPHWSAQYGQWVGVAGMMWRSAPRRAKSNRCAPGHLR